MATKRHMKHEDHKIQGFYWFSMRRMVPILMIIDELAKTGYSFGTVSELLELK